jgi:hypothetical protein
MRFAHEALAKIRAVAISATAVKLSTEPSLRRRYTGRREARTTGTDPLHRPWLRFSVCQNHIGLMSVLRRSGRFPATVQSPQTERERGRRQAIGQTIVWFGTAGLQETTGTSG